MKKIITFGTFDVFHVGHLRILQRAAALGNHLTVGVSSDKLNKDKKGRLPIYPEHDRMKIINSLACVDEVFIEHSLEQKGEYLIQFKSDTLVMGDDWKGRFDKFENLCEIVYLTRTPSISTSEIIEVVKTAPHL